jgi:alpha-tubulin suppressor-like RCC1 family protein
VRGFHGCGVRRDTSLWCWGFNTSGELGLGDTIDRSKPEQSGCPADSDCLTGWTAVAAGDFHTCALRDGGELWCWGGGANGQLGTGVIDNGVSHPTRVEMAGWRTITGGGSHTCGIQEDGTLWCWGQNSRGQLGVGDVERRAVPTQVQVAGSGSWAEVSLGISHSCAIRSDSSLWCWGEDTDGQLGQGGDPPVDTADPVTTPRRVCLPPVSR